MVQQTTDSPHPALKLRHTLRGHTSNVHRMALSPDGRTLASPSVDKTVRLWEVESGRLLRTLKHQEAVVCVGWSLDGMTLATGTGIAKNEVCLWNATTGQQIRTLEGHRETVLRFDWSPDGKVLASCSNDKTVRLWDAANGRGLQELKGHSEAVLLKPIHI
uniref:WD domain-containing protein, G-beta repeat-containing protein n=1 Tax=Candidatus Kentrum sp. TUN TaxID=2126343 RepID=A0A451A6P7_9GAMM|nr:MAG: WD domain-containing protein, G-beta repeat-containing protein [Candidatus Kentron sp. TUN]VFK70766.1 MAG: WD domain-containing protein, G-beta repeat-containing protein [Candidatus Kentron sp. TUN]